MLDSNNRLIYKIRASSLGRQFRFRCVALVLVLCCFSWVTSVLCSAQDHDVLCSDGSGSFQAEFHTGVSVQVKATRTEELATRTCEAALRWDKQSLIVAANVALVLRAQGVEARALYDSLRDRFGRQMRARDLDLVLGKAPAGAHPHHSFHVLEVCPRNGWPQAKRRRIAACVDSRYASSALRYNSRLSPNVS